MDEDKAGCVVEQVTYYCVGDVRLNVPPTIVNTIERLGDSHKIAAIKLLRWFSPGLLVSHAQRIVERIQHDYDTKFRSNFN